MAARRVLPVFVALVAGLGSPSPARVQARPLALAGRPLRALALGGRLAPPRARRCAARASDAPWPELPPLGESARPSGAAVASCAALVAGTTIGAGALALPAATAACGFAPSAAALLVGWVLMASSALLLAEATVNIARASGRADVGLAAATSHTLGAEAGACAGLASGLVQLALLSAYAAQGGAELGAFAAAAAGALGAAPPPAAAGACAFTVLLGGAAALGSPRLVGALNGALVCALCASVVRLLALAAPHVSLQRLGAASDWAATADALPICALALVFHNVVPAVCRRLRGDAVSIRRAIVLGSGLPFLLFVLWEAAVLGAADLGAGADPLASLRALAAAEPAGPLGALTALAPSAFALAAVSTSYLGFAIGQTDVLVDMLGLDRTDQAAVLGAYALALLPPLAVALARPDVFTPALDAAGAFGVTSLYVLLPVALAWRCRYGGGADLAPAVELLPFGRPALLVLVALALAIISDGALDRFT